MTPRASLRRSDTRTRRRRPLILVAALVVLAAAGCGDDDDTGVDPGDGTGGATGAPASTVEVNTIDFSFDPVEITVPAGSAVVWTNRGEVGHTTVSDDGVWESDVLAPGDSFEVVVDEPGTYPYFCDIHPSLMRAIVIVEG